MENTKEEYYSWNDYNLELLKQSFNKENNEYKDSYDEINWSPITFLGGNRDELKEFIEDVQSKVANLRKLVSKLDLLKSEVLDYELKIENEAR